jgi:outer membrane protein
VKSADNPRKFQANLRIGPDDSGDAGVIHNKENTVNSRIILRAAAVAAVCLLGTAAMSQSAPSGGAAAPAKVAIINFRGAIGATAEGKQASAELQSQFSSRSAEIDGLTRQINDLQQKLQAGQGKLSEDEVARLTNQGQRLTQQLDRRRNDFQEDAGAAQQEVLERIGRKMVDVIDHYARENGYSVVLDTSGQNSPILYASNQVNVTEDIVRLYDQAYPVKTAGTATGSGTTKPAAAPAKPSAPNTSPTKQQ